MCLLAIVLDSANENISVIAEFSWIAFLRILKIHIHVLSWAPVVGGLPRFGGELGLWSVNRQGLNSCSAMFLLCSLKQRNFMFFLGLSVVICRMGDGTLERSCEV